MAEGPGAELFYTLFYPWELVMPERCQPVTGVPSGHRRAAHAGRRTQAVRFVALPAAALVSQVLAGPVLVRTLMSLSYLHCRPGRLKFVSLV